MHDIPCASGSRRMVLLVMSLGLLAMLAASFAHRLGNPHLVVESAAGRGMGGQAEGMGGADGMSPEVGALMRQISENPNDYKAVVHLAEHLVSSQQWDAAETFARRAMVLSPGESQPLYLLGVALHNKGQNNEAAEALEKVLTIKDEASVRYSLGVLYIYYLNNVPKGVEHLSAGLHDEKAPEALKRSIREELEKAPLPGTKPAK